MLGRLLTGLVLGWLPVMGLVGWCSIRLFVAPTVDFVVAALYALTVLTVSAIRVDFRCPRCNGRRYARLHGFVINYFAKEGGRCGLRKWQCGDVN
jgi:hypothetical protein